MIRSDTPAREWPYLGTRAGREALFRAELLAAALGYAAKGYPVFPVGADKRPLVKWKDGATTDRETIIAWWRRWPLAMIGLPTGGRSGVIVLDVDRKGGVDGLEELRKIGFDPFKMTPIIALTPSGGLHFFFKYDPAKPLKNSAGLLAPGVDVRADGGFVVLPPSIRSIDQDEYQWDWGGAAL